MNAAHLDFCSSPEWRQMIEEIVLPAAIRDLDLGDDVLEVGPGFGFVTDVLRNGAKRLTAVEIDPDLAGSLQQRLAGTNVDVVEGDATALDFPDDRFTSAVSLNMLHHVPTSDLQDSIFRELARVLRAGGVLVAADSTPRDEYDEFHAGDTYNPINPDDLAVRLATAGFTDIDVGLYDLGWTCAARTSA
ncbi:MAG: class I SAM-dependent methyltransferase [Acidimicrobiia bacterium]